MIRRCANCRRAFTPADLDAVESRAMETERKASRLRGMRFLYYRCPGCGFADIFVDVLRLEGEGQEEVRRRRAELERVVKQLRGDRVKVIVAAPEPATASA